MTILLGQKCFQLTLRRYPRLGGPCTLILRWRLGNGQLTAISSESSAPPSGASPA